MKYTWRIVTLSIWFTSSIFFKINVFLTMGYIPLYEWVLSFVFVYPVWWVGLQIDKAKFYAKEVEKKDKELQELFNSVDAAIYSFDYQSNKLMISSKVRDLYGYSPDEFKQNLQLWKEMIYPEDLDIVNDLNQELVNGRDAMGEYRVQLPNGQLKWIQKRVSPILDLDGNIIKVNGIDLDIDHQKKVEELLHYSQEQNRELLVKRLEESEQRFKSLFIHNPDAIFTFDLDGKLIEANQSAEELVGYTNEELKKVEWESIFIQEDLDVHRKHFKHGSKGQRQEFTLSIIRKDGEKRLISLKMIPIIFENQIIGIYEIAKDITDAKLAEEMMRRSDKLAVVGQLAAGVAHEIRNPLTTLKGFVQYFKSRIDEHIADVMLTELDRINLIVSEFLILSKPQAIKYEYNDLKQIIHDIVSLMEPQVMAKNTKFLLIFDEDLPLLKCEQNQLKQVFINLLKNAMEAMPNGGGITIEVKMINHEVVKILVIDEGVGIAKEQIRKLGEPFYSTKENGTGLGLMVSFRIIENHGGTMKILSELNKGTTIEICLPINHFNERSV